MACLFSVCFCELNYTLSVIGAAMCKSSIYLLYYKIIRSIFADLTNGGLYKHLTGCKDLFILWRYPAP